VTQIPKYVTALDGFNPADWIELQQLAVMLDETGDQWSAVLGLASTHVGSGQDPALTTSLVHNIAVSMMARLSMQLNKRLQVFYGWEIIDKKTVITLGDEGFVAMNGVMIDDRDVGLVLVTEKHLNEPETFPITVLRYNAIWKVEINNDECAWEGMVDLNG